MLANPRWENAVKNNKKMASKTAKVLAATAFQQI